MKNQTKCSELKTMQRAPQRGVGRWSSRYAGHCALTNGVERRGDDVVAARRQVDGLLEEEIRSGEGAAQRWQKIDARDRHARERTIEALGGAIAQQFAAGLRDRLLRRR